MSAIDLSANIGEIASVLLTLNILLGLLISVRYDPLRRFPHRAVDIFQLHNWTGYIALGVSALHPLPLLWSARMRFSLAQIAWPTHAPSQAVDNLLGAIALYLIAIVVVTSYFRVELGKPLWKKIHWVSYGAAVLFFVHGLLLDPELQNRPVDWLDAEKVWIEVCMLLVLVATLVRWRYAERHPMRLRVIPPLSYSAGFKEPTAAAKPKS